MADIVHERTRYPVVNGIFYPNRAETLTKMLCSWGLKKGKTGISCGGQVIIAPHGAWNLTGEAIKRAFTAVQKKRKNAYRSVKTIILLGSDTNSGEEGIYLSESSVFETPLGHIEVDSDINEALSSCSTLIKVNDIPHLLDYSLEVLLPLVKYCFPKAKIVPILISGKKPVLITALSRAIKIVFEKQIDENLFIISSNVAQSENPALAAIMAEEFCSLLLKMDSDAFLNCLNRGSISASGSVPVAALLQSGILGSRCFHSLCRLKESRGEMGETVYYGAFGSG